MGMSALNRLYTEMQQDLDATPTPPRPQTVDDAGLRDRVAAALVARVLSEADGRHLERGTRTLVERSASANADAAMTEFAPVLAARDIRISELEVERYGTLARRCAIPGCLAFYDAADGPAPEQATADRHWLRTSSPHLLLCPDHVHLWEGDTPHRPRLDHTTSTCACTCGHPLPGPTLGHMGAAWIAHALALLGADDGPDASDFSHMEHEADKLRDRIAELEESVRVHRESMARLDGIKAERGARIVELEKRLAGSVTIRPEAAGGQACIGGTRIPARIIAGLVPDVGEDGVADYYPSVTPAGARAAARFTELYVEREDLAALEAQAAAVRALHACETHYHQAEAPYPYHLECDHCDAPLRDAAGTLTENHFADGYGTLRCRVRPRRTCTHCIIQEEEAPWPCATKIALDGDTHV